MPPIIFPAGSANIKDVDPVPHVPGDRDHRLPGEWWTIESAQLIAAHESSRTTELYDRTGDEITLDEVERIVI